MEAFQVAVISPGVALCLELVVAWIGTMTDEPKPPIRVLVLRTILYAVIGAAVSLAGTILWMSWYERTTGYGTGNAPIAWIFFYGPLSVAVGQLVALIHWWITKPTANSHTLDGTT